MGTFHDEEYKRKIIAETLTVNGEIVFQRIDNIKFGNMKVIKDYLSDITEKM